MALTPEPEALSSSPLISFHGSPIPPGEQILEEVEIEADDLVIGYTQRKNPKLGISGEAGKFKSRALRIAGGAQKTISSRALARRYYGPGVTLLVAGFRSSKPILDSFIDTGV